MLVALLLGVLNALPTELAPQRQWLEHVAPLVPAPGLTRWLLAPDALCLVALGLGTRRRALGVPVALGAGFLGLNVLGIVLNDFYLALAAFHLAAPTAALLAAPPARWVGGAALALALALGLLT